MTIKGLYKLCLGPGGSFRPERVPASRTGERDRWIQSRWIGTEVLSRVCVAASAELGEPASSPVSCLRGRTVVGSHLTDTPHFVSFQETYQALMVKIREKSSVLLLGNSKETILKQPEHSIANKEKRLKKKSLFILF